MKTVKVHEAKTHLSRLLRRVSTGEEIVIAKGGKPIARLVPVDRPRARGLGSDEGRLVVPTDFDAPRLPSYLPTSSNEGAARQLRPYDVDLTWAA